LSGFAFSWILFVWLVLVPCPHVAGCGGWDNEEIRWESVPTRPFWANLSNKETQKEWLWGSGLLDKDYTKQNLTKADV
jgi:hypothetical protein